MTLIINISYIVHIVWVSTTFRQLIKVIKFQIYVKQINISIQNPIFWACVVAGCSEIDFILVIRARYFVWLRVCAVLSFGTMT